MKKSQRNDANVKWSFLLAVIMGIFTLCMITACHKEHHKDPLKKQLAELRQATAPFHHIEWAHKAGYTIPIPDNPQECLADPNLGGMGFHFGKGSLISNTTLTVSEPEVVIYEPQSDSSLELVGVEYVVPFSLWAKDKTPPKLFGQEFMQNERFQVWALHVWVWRHNPSGLFTPYNPDVSCDPYQCCIN